MIINHKSGKGGVVGKDGTTPHIGTNGNWFLGETDTGVAAQGKSDTRIETILLPVADWAGETLSQTVACAGVLEDETKQIITTVALPGNEEVCETCHIVCSAFAKDSLTFTALAMPEADVYLYVILENVSGGNNAASNAYSTEETVIGTWIDGKPIYRRTFMGIGPSTNNTVCLDASGVVDVLVNHYGYFDDMESWHNYLPFVYQTTHRIHCTLSKPDNILGLLCQGYLNYPFVVTCEYTKTTDTATVAIPSTTALMEAYKEGVNEA